MRRALAVKGRIRTWLIATVLTAGLGWASTAGAAENLRSLAEDLGAVVEKVGKGFALDRAGLRPGDVVLAWERLPAPPANPQGVRGTIESVFDWMWLRIEQAPRGTVKLTVQRDGEDKILEVAPGRWDATLRARLRAGMLEGYAKGKELIEAEELEAGIDVWRKVVAMAEAPNVDGRLRCWFLLRIGGAWGEARQWEKAQGAYRSALAAARDPLARVAIWRTLGKAYEKASDLDAAREAYGSAQKIRENTWGESLTLAMGLNDLGDLDWKQGRLDSAQGYLQRALEIHQKLAPQSLSVAGSLNSLGNVASERRDLTRATEHYEQALSIKQKLAPDSVEVAVSLSNLGIMAYHRGDLDCAAEYHEGAMEIDQKLAPQSLDVAASLGNLGLVASRRGDLARTAEYYERALEIQQKLAPQSLILARNLNNLGIVAYDRGDLARAAEYLKRALEIQQKLAPGSLAMAATLDNLGVVASGRGDWARAAEHHERALEVSQKLAPQSGDVARRLSHLGIVASGRGDWARAAEYHEWALEIKQKQAPHSLPGARDLNNLGLVAYGRGDLARAAKYYEKALEILQKRATDGFSMALSLHSLGLVAHGRGDLARAAEYYQDALQIQQKRAPGSTMEAEILNRLGAVYREQKQSQQALALFLQALKALESQVSRLGGSRDVQAGFRAKRAEYYRDTLDLFLELHQAEAAFHTLERSRGQSFLAQLAERDLVFSDVPEELERERRRIAHSYDQTQDQVARLHPRKQAKEIEDLLAQLRRLRLEHEDTTEEIIQASPKLGALRYPRPLGFAAAQEALDPGTVMLSYSVGESETHLFVLTRDDKLQVLNLPVGEEELRREVEALLKLQKTRAAAPYEEPLRRAGERLFQVLIQPAEESIARNERVLLVPDGPLHYLPFALLVRKNGSGKDQGDRDFEYLVEWKPLHSVLSATVYAELKKKRRSPADGAPGALALAAFGDPQYPSESSGERFTTDRGVDIYVRAAAQRGFHFRPLPYSRDEVTRIAALYAEGTASTYLGSEATEERAKSLGQKARILHFATHGRFDHRIPMNSYLALAIPNEFRKDRDNGLLQTWEIFEDVRLEADLVVLSACESGLGDELDTEGLIGLVRAFQFAGARTVAATLWQVDDEATAELMTRFYRHLRSGKPKDEALRSAQLELIRGPIEMKDQQGRITARDLSLPYYWAAFQLIGDWQ